ncbi:MAG TPA: TonB-dependent receptor [Steroidobacteraceae bacterium]|nr:TonB-dependent receptor [Steroidobacteraceae bacterium]
MKRITIRMAGAGVAAALAVPASAQMLADASDALTQLSRMSLEELANVEVTSVSKAAQSLSSAPASIYVITHEELRHSGALSIPEALRLAPNLQVEQINAQEYQITARGFGGNLELQNFSNKILILIDGRSVYNPLFSGVAYDSLDVVMDDVDRIEVISGPGATLWGANAMNGVINIITRNARDSQGGLLRASAGNQDNALSARYGGAFGDGAAFRIHAKGFDRGPSELPDGNSAGDRWHKLQTGFRLDLGAETDADRFTVQGDYQDATENAGEFGDVGFRQYDLLGRWERRGAEVDTRLQVYFDRHDRGPPPTGVALELDTYDLDFQQGATLGRHRLVWGLGRRYNDYQITSTPTLRFVPAHRTLELTNVFAQDTIALGQAFRLTLGMKFEENSYSGWAALPDVRLAWAPDDTSLVWAKAARAIRSPTPFDTDVQEWLEGTQLFLAGDPDFEPESVDAFELGYRSQPHAAVSWSLSAFYNEFDDLRSIEISPATILPLLWGNRIEGDTYGVEFWANWQVTPWWRLSPGFRSLHKRLRASEGAAELFGTEQAGNDPTSQGSLKSSMDFGRWSLDAMLRYVGKLPSPHTPSYTELGARAAWRASESLELSLNGVNLLDDRHREYAAPTAREIRRAVYAEARWTF